MLLCLIKSTLRRQSESASLWYKCSISGRCLAPAGFASIFNCSIKASAIHFETVQTLKSGMKEIFSCSSYLAFRCCVFSFHSNSG